MASLQATSTSRNSKDKSKRAFTYPHPILKSQSIETQTRCKYPPSYTQFNCHDPSFPSCKVLRCSNHQPSQMEQFGVILQPLHSHSDSFLQFSERVICKKCGVVASFHLSSQTPSDKCHICNQNNQTYPAHSKQTYACFDLVSDPLQSQHSQRNVCFAIEASQFNYNHNLIAIILNNLKHIVEPLNVGFIFFDAKNVYFLNQASCELIKINAAQLNNFTELPLQLSDFYALSSAITQESTSLLKEFIYESFFISQSALFETALFMAKVFPTHQIKLFITTLTHPQQASSLPLLKDNSNIITAPIKVLRDKSQKPALTVTPNMDFFIILHNTSYQQAITKIGGGICRIYQPSLRHLPQMMHYDLYENFTDRKYFNAELVVTVSKRLLIERFKSTFGNETLISTQTGDSFRTYTFLINKLHRNTTIPVKFFVTANRYSQFVNNSMQFRVSFLNQGRRTERILNFELQRVVPAKEFAFDLVDDETYFYFLLKEALDTSRDPQKMKQLLAGKLRELARIFKNHYAEREINFPLSFKHVFMYGYLLEKHLNNQPNTLYHLHTMLSTLEFMSKTIYPRVYEFVEEQDKIVNVKYYANKFKADRVTFLENGRQLSMILGDIGMDKVKDFFGKFDEIKAINDNIFELPDLQSNNCLRRAITQIRGLNETHFLPLNILELFSKDFQQVAPFIYRKEEHKNYLYKLWRD